MLRKIVKTNGNLWNVSAFEVKNNACDSDEETCSLKFSSHVPSKRNRFTLVVSNEEINKRFSLKGGDDQSSLTINSKNGYKLIADILIEKLQLVSGRHQVRIQNF